MKRDRTGITLQPRAAFLIHLPLAFALAWFLCAAPTVFAQPRGHAKTHTKYTAHNIAILIDTSAHMSILDRECGKTQLACALAGVRTLLSKMYPCKPSAPTCGPANNGNVPDPVDKVSVFVIPNVRADRLIHEYDCTGSRVRNSPYTFPQPGADSYVPGPSEPSYRIIDFSSDYRSEDTKPELNPDSNLVKALGGRPGCPSLSDTGGFGTYYAGAIYAAQASLIAERKATPRAKNVMIVIGDGNAGSTQYQLQPRHGEAPVVPNDSGVYPSWVNECGQTVTAAKAAQKAGTKVYSVVYGGSVSFQTHTPAKPISNPTPNPRSYGCATDTSGASKGIHSCTTMQRVASSPAYFFSDAYNNTVNGDCVSLKHPNLNLDQIFTQIGLQLQPQHPRTKPNPQ